MKIYLATVHLHIFKIITLFFAKVTFQALFRLDQACLDNSLFLVKNLPSPKCLYFNSIDSDGYSFFIFISFLDHTFKRCRYSFPSAFLLIFFKSDRIRFSLINHGPKQTKLCIWYNRLLSKLKIGISIKTLQLRDQ